MRKPLYILALLALSSNGSYAQQPNANEILTKVASTYATCRTYYDEGLIKTNLRGFGDGHFRTTFVRPNHLTFELWLGGNKNPKNSWVVWKNRDSIRSWVPSDLRPGFGNLKESAIDTALAQLAFPSAGSSLTVPPLLLPSSFRISDLLASLSDVRVTGEEKIDGRETFLLEGKLWQEQVRLWVDKTQYLIVKTSRKVSLGDRKVETTVRFNPKLNTEIPAEVFSLKMPSEKTTESAWSGSATPSSLSPPILTPRRRRFGASLALSSIERARRLVSRSGDDDEIVRVDTDLVVAPVLVLDGEGKIVTGLTKGDFIVKEDDTLQEMATFSLGDSEDVPRSIVLIIDYSGSQLPYIETSVEAAKTLVDKLNPKDRMAVVTDDVKLLVDFTSDKDLLKNRLEGLKESALSGALGASDQYDALMAAVTELFNAEDTRPIVIFQTDGDQLESLNGGIPQPYNVFSLPRKFSLADILTAAERSRATVYSVISGVRFFNVPESELLERAEADWANRAKASRQLFRQNNSASRYESNRPSSDILKQQADLWVRRHTSLAAVAKFTGAWTEFLEQPQQADEIYNRILTDIERRYIIGYYPKNKTRDGKRRKVQIEVRNHPEYLVWGQKAYFARDEQR